MATEHLKPIPARAEQSGSEWELGLAPPSAHLCNPVSGARTVNAQSGEGKLSDRVWETLDFPLSLFSSQVVMESQCESQSGLWVELIHGKMSVTLIKQAKE